MYIAFAVFCSYASVKALSDIYERQKARFIIKGMVTSPSWMAVRERLAVILYSGAPLVDRYNNICKELEPLNRGYAALGVRLELDSMARSAADSRESPFLDVGKDLLTYCDSQLYRELEAQGEDPRWITELRRHEQEIAERERLRETEEELDY